MFNNLLHHTIHEVPSAIDFARNSGAMGATSLEVASIGELEEALAKWGEVKGPDFVVIDTDPYPSTPHGGTWWDVAVPEVSERAEVNAACAIFDENKKTQRAD